MNKKFSRTLRPDHQIVDEVVIKTVPRYKDSEISGDEWRISGLIQLKVKGKVIREEIYRDIKTAMDFLKAKYWELSDAGRDHTDHEEEFCDQEGCLNKWSVMYRLKNRYMQDGSKRDAGDYYNHRAFCARHSQRGDCGLDDADANYEQVYPPTVATTTQQEGSK